jgi:hypothetical protein
MQTDLREDLDTFHAVLLLPGFAGDEPDAGFLRHVPPDDATCSFETLFAAGKPLRQVRDSQRAFLFGARRHRSVTGAADGPGTRRPAGARRETRRHRA